MNDLSELFCPRCNSRLTILQPSADRDGFFVSCTTGLCSSECAEDGAAGPTLESAFKQLVSNVAKE